MMIAFAGMTHLGVNSAVAAAVRGFEGIGFDPSSARTDSLARGVPAFSEPGLLEALQDYADRLVFTSEPEALHQADLVVIAPDVPTDDSGRADRSGLRALIKDLDAGVSAETPFIVMSQLEPGFCRSMSLKPNRPFYHQVETLIFGQALARAVSPERIIVGCKNPEDPIHPVVLQYLKAFECPLLPMSYESAELAKIAINCFLVAQVSTTNMLAELCEEVGADWRQVSPALRLDKRIGKHAYLSPGLGIAGGNLERDLQAVSDLSARHGTDSRLVPAWRANSAYRAEWVLRKIYEVIVPINERPVLAVLGLAYKKDTNSIRNSPSVALLESLRAVECRAFDPQVDARSIPGLNLASFGSRQDAMSGADALVIMTPWDVFKDITLEELKSTLAGKIILDPYNVLVNEDGVHRNFTVYTLGSS